MENDLIRSSDLRRASIEQALAFCMAAVQDLDELKAETEDDEVLKIAGEFQAAIVTAMEALIAQQKREDPEPPEVGMDGGDA